MPAGDILVSPMEVGRIILPGITMDKRILVLSAMAEIFLLMHARPVST